MTASRLRVYADFPPSADPQGNPCPLCAGVDDGSGSGFPAIIDALFNKWLRFVSACPICCGV